MKSTNEANIGRVGKPDTSAGNPRASEVDADYTRVGDTSAEFDHGIPLLKPPYGNLTAIDLNRGEIKWHVPFGDMPQLRQNPALAGVTLPAQLGAPGAPGTRADRKRAALRRRRRRGAARGRRRDGRDLWSHALPRAHRRARR